GRRVLLTGDIETAAGAQLLSDCGADLHADVLKVPHHGSASFDADFFCAVHPTWAVISADYNCSSHHLPRVESIERLQQLGATIFSTSSDGFEDVSLEVDALGQVSWRHPTRPFSAWTKEHEERSFPQ